MNLYQVALYCTVEDQFRGAGHLTEVATYIS